jgi:hypothetical protein
MPLDIKYYLVSTIDPRPELSGLYTYSTLSRLIPLILYNLINSYVTYSFKTVYTFLSLENSDTSLKLANSF